MGAILKYALHRHINRNKTNLEALIFDRHGTIL